MGIKEINKSYRKIFFNKNILLRLTESIMIFLSEGSCFLGIYILFGRYFNISSFFKAIILGIIYMIFHYLIGYILLLSSRIHEFMNKSVEDSIEGYFLLSYFIISVYSFFLIIFPKVIKIFFIPGVLGFIICYILNLKILFKIMRNPKNIKFTKADSSNLSKLTIAALVIVSMIIINLYLGVCLIKAYDVNAFSNNPSNFDLLYFTITTFTTIGFGDIVPINFYAKLITILIAFSSVVVITIFLGSIFSYKKEDL